MPISPASKCKFDTNQIKRNYLKREVNFAAVEDRFVERQLLSPSSSFRGGSYNKQSSRFAAAWNVKSHKKNLLKPLPHEENFNIRQRSQLT